MQLNEGIYRGRITQAVLSKNKNENPVVELMVELLSQVDGEEEYNLDAAATRTVRWYLSDKASETTFAKLESIGFNGDFDDPRFNDEAVGEGIMWRCRHEEYEGKTKEKWDLKNWGGGGLGEKVDAFEVKEWNERWSKRIAASVPKTSPKPSTKPAATGPAIADAKKKAKSAVWAEVQAALPGVAKDQQIERMKAFAKERTGKAIEEMSIDQLNELANTINEHGMDSVPAASDDSIPF